MILWNPALLCGATDPSQPPPGPTSAAIGQYDYNVPYVDLPMLNLSGQWTVGEREREVVAEVVAGLPPAATSGADAETRWKAALSMLNHVRGAIQEQSAALLGDGPVRSIPGAVSLVDIMFEAARAVVAVQSTVERMAAMDPASLFRPSPYLDALDTDVTRLRGYLTEAAS
jgi:hypothetical protein